MDGAGGSDAVVTRGQDTAASIGKGDVSDIDTPSAGLIRLRSAQDLSRLVARHDAWHTAHTQVRAEFTTLTSEENHAWTRRLTGRFNDCGCNIGACVLVGVLLLCVLDMLLVPGHRPQTIPGSLLRIAAMLLTAFIAGKAIGVTTVRLRLHSAALELTRALHAREPCLGKRETLNEQEG